MFCSWFTSYLMLKSLEISKTLHLSSVHLACYYLNSKLQHCAEHCAILAVTGINNNVINTMVASIMFAVPETNLVDP